MPSNLRLLSLYRFSAIVVSFLGTLLNLVLAILTFRCSFRWEAESSEWEWLADNGDKWRVLGFRVVWILFSSYFAAAAAISAVGLARVIKNKPSLVRFYRDCYFADFAFCASSFTIVVSATFQKPARIGICEEFARHPELVREMDINAESCELWLSRAALGLVALLFTVIILRLHFLLALSNYYSGLLSHYSCTCCISRHHDRLIAHSRQRSHSDAFLLSALPAEGIELVHVPVNKLGSHDDRPKAEELWLSETLSVPAAGQHGVVRRHCHSRRHSCVGINNNNNDRSGLLVHPEEGLLTVDRDYVKV